MKIQFKILGQKIEKKKKLGARTPWLFFFQIFSRLFFVEILTFDGWNG